jgi:hypothetical protein
MTIPNIKKLETEVLVDMYWVEKDKYDKHLPYLSFDYMHWGMARDVEVTMKAIRHELERRGEVA